MCLLPICKHDNKRFHLNHNDDLNGNRFDILLSTLKPLKLCLLCLSYLSCQLSYISRFESSLRFHFLKSFSLYVCKSPKLHCCRNNFRLSLYYLVIFYPIPQSSQQVPSCIVSTRVRKFAYLRRRFTLRRLFCNVKF